MHGTLRLNHFIVAKLFAEIDFLKEIFYGDKDHCEISNSNRWIDIYIQRWAYNIFGNYVKRDCLVIILNIWLDGK